MNEEEIASSLGFEDNYKPHRYLPNGFLDFLKTETTVEHCNYWGHIQQNYNVYSHFD